MNTKNHARCFAALLFAFACVGGLAAQDAETASAAESGDPLVVKIAVIGPGDELYFWWGHIGLIIEDYRSGKTRFYDWGVFSFENENFFANFAFGRLLYTCAVSTPDWNFGNYLNTNRDITVYTLNLPADKKEEIRQYAEWTVLPENKDYYYHHFRDNCATRVRDILDMATNGQFREQYVNTPGRFTLRQHVRRHTWFNPFFDWMLNFLMGQGIDTPITVWDEMFLPSEIGARIEEFTYRDSDGSAQKIFQSVEIVNRAVGRPAVLDTPRTQWQYELALGCVIALCMIALLVLKARDMAAAHFGWALGQGALGLFFGAMGSVLFFMTFFTNHDYTYRNINILFTNPLFLAALPLGILYCVSIPSMEHRKWELLIKSLWTLLFLLGLVSIPVNVLFLGQSNAVDLCLFLPIAAALSWLPDCLVYVRREYLWRWLN